jgi:hypothetical protein
MIDNHDNQEALRQAFVAETLEAEREILRAATAFSAEEVHAFIRALAARKKPARPKPKHWHP